MASPYVGEIRLVGWNFAAVGWALCQGQLMAISENPVLYQLIGTTYGGDGINTFALPNLQCRVPMHRQSGGFQIGQQGGEESVTLTSNTIPSHSHSFNASTANATATTPAGNTPATVASGGGNIYFQETPTAQLNSQSIGMGNGLNLPHENMQPYQAVNFIISLYGQFPSQG